MVQAGADTSQLLSGIMLQRMEREEPTAGTSSHLGSEDSDDEDDKDFEKELERSGMWAIKSLQAI